MSPCPGDDRLVRLLEEQLDRLELVDIERHLELCDRCQETLEGLTRERFSLAGWQPWLDSEADPDDPTYRDREWAPASSRSGGGWSPGAGHPSTWPSGPDPAADGETPEVEGYEILGRLGQGGMGIVYRARQHGLERLVALKMIRGGPHAAPEHLARFRIEARAVARLRHPNVVQVHDVGRAGGLPYVALELLEGGSLESKVAGTPQPERSSAELMVMLAGAIAAAHRAGVVHRDLKSANVLYSADGTPKVVDFGLAKRLDEDDGQTRTGQVMGSPSFMSPEQARGKGRDVGPASDLYSLGAILYEMLVGRPPFKGPSAMDTLLQVVNDDPVPPSQLRRGLSRDLETICLKCLEKQPGRRYDSAEALADDLRRYLNNVPILARRVGLGERASKWTKRQPAAASLVLLVLASAIALGGWGAVALKRRRADEEARARRVADYTEKSRSVLLEGRLALSDGQYDAGLDGLKRFREEIVAVPGLDVLRGDVAGLIDRLEAASKARREALDARTRFGAFQRLRHEAQVVDAQIIGAGELGDAEATRKAALAALGAFEADAQAIARGQEPSTLPAVLTREQKEEVERGRHELMLIWAEAVARTAPGEDPIAQARSALALLDRIARDRLPTRADHMLRADCLARIGDRPAAAAARKAAESMPIADSFGHVLRGQEFYRGRRWVEAIAEFEKALGGEADHFRAQLLLAICQLQKERPDLAIPWLTACLDREPKSISLRLLRGFALGEEGYHRIKLAREAGSRLDGLKAEAETRFEAAEADYREALTLGPGPGEQYGLRANRGTLRLRRDRLEEAVTDLAAAIELRPDQFTARVTLAQAYRRQGKTEEAVAQFTRAIELKPDMAALYRGRALARLGSGRPSAKASEAAIADLTDAIRLERPGTAESAADRARRARLHLIAGRPLEALADCEAGLRAAPNDPEALLGRVKALLELKRFDEVVGACEDALSRGKPSADLLEYRGLARSSRRDYAGAIQDFTQALALDPGRSVPLIQRGWAYLASDAPRLALSDFDEAIRVTPDEPDGYSGRGFARVLHGQHQAGVLDAEESLRHGPEDARSAYNAARVYARAANSVTVDAPRRNLGQLDLANRYSDRAQALVRLALDRMPADRRAAFWDDVIQADPALAAVRQRPKFSRMAGQLGTQSR